MKQEKGSPASESRIRESTCSPALPPKLLQNGLRNRRRTCRMFVSACRRREARHATPEGLGLVDAGLGQPEVRPP